jgi:hypothetical protein
MQIEAALRCTCGRVTGAIGPLSPRAVRRVICYCAHCQAFAHYLGRGDEVLDAHDGTDILQCSQGRVQVTGGKDLLACLQLTERGPLRWFADCCKTPIGNTPADPRVAIVGVIANCLKRVPGDLTPADRFGPVLGHLFPTDAMGAPPRSPTRLEGRGRLLRILIGARLTGARRHSPFFDHAGRPVAEPRADELQDD